MRRDTATPNPIYGIVFLMGLLWLTSFTIEFLSIAELTGTVLRIIGMVIAAFAFVTTAAVALVTNTRQHWIDPTAPRYTEDPFGLTTEDLHGFVGDSTRGRRKVDNSEATKRIIAHLEREPMRVSRIDLDLEEPE